MNARISTSLGALVIVLGFSASPSLAITILSTTGNASLGGLSFRDGDLAAFDMGVGSLYFNEDTFAADEDIDAVHVRNNRNIIFSTTTPARIAGLAFQDGDLVEYNPTTGTATLLFSESLFSSSEDIDAVHILDNGHIVLSTDSDAVLGGLLFTDGDLVSYDPIANLATLLFSESNFVGSEDIDAVLIQKDGKIVLSTQTPATLGGLAFNEADLVEYDPLTDTATLFFDHTLFAIAADIDAVSVPEPAGWALIAQLLLVCTFFGWRSRPQLARQKCAA